MSIVSLFPARRLIALIALAAPAFAAERTGAEAFAQACQTCHAKDNTLRAPLPEALARLPRARIVAALETGSMKAQGAALTAAERQSVAAYLSTVTAESAGTANACPPNLKPAAGPAWQGWGVDLRNTRHQPAARVSPAWKLKWAFAFPNATVVFGTPVVAGGRLYIGSQSGVIHAFDAGTGCLHWAQPTSAGVRTALTVAGGRLYFGDVKAHVHAIQAADGSPLWKTKVDDHPFARVTGSPVLHQGRLYVPVSSVEEVAPANPQYPCCTFRGSVVALDAATGRILWKQHTIPEEPRPTAANSAGVMLQGPSGAAVWTAPTIDEQRKVLYVGTGNSYSEPANGASDAVIALDLATGARRWVKQLTPADRWNMACSNPNKANCPADAGGDFDIGASPVLGRYLYVGQKSGLVYALDPDRQGAVVWQTRIGHGGALGGIQWGMALDEQALYVPLSDFGVDRRKPDVKPGGLFALDPRSGKTLWSTLPPKPVAFMAAATVAGNGVFAGAMDGWVRMYDTKTGKVAWEFDTRAGLTTVNGENGRGGSISGGGPVLAAGMLFVTSGYGSLGGAPGNLLLAFE